MCAGANVEDPAGYCCALSRPGVCQQAAPAKYFAQGQHFTVCPITMSRESWELRGLLVSYMNLFYC